MDLNNCKIISEVEYGSTFQGLSDKYSDLDRLFLVIQPLTDTIFKDVKNAQKVNEGDRYYSIEKFTNFILNGSYDSFLLLAAQLAQAKNCSFNQNVLEPILKKDQGFNELYKSKRVKIIWSLIGEMNQLIKKTDFKFNGKELIKFLNQLNKAEYFYKQENLDLSEFLSHLNFKEATDLLEYKRLEHHQVKDFDFLDEILLRERFETFVLNFKTEHGNWKKYDFKLENKLKQEVTKYLVTEYKKEL